MATDGDITELLAQARERRRALGLPDARNEAYRLFHGVADGVDGLTVDVHGPYAVVSLYTEEVGARERGWLAAVAKMGFQGVYLKHRPKQANELRDEERRARTPEHAVHGIDAPPTLLVHENGVPFEVKLADGLSAGLFLDQRENRARFGREASGKRVLNLFAYTCAFGVVAARGGATSSTNLDVSKPALERGKRNYALSGLMADAASHEARHLFLARDVLETLPKLARRRQEYDLIALDPPSYASTANGRFSVERDYASLVAAALSVLATDGCLLACTNHSRLSERDLAAAIDRAAQRVGRRVRALEFAAPPADFPTARERVPHLKSAWVRL